MKLSALLVAGLVATSLPTLAEAATKTPSTPTISMSTAPVMTSRNARYIYVNIYTPGPILFFADAVIMSNGPTRVLTPNFNNCTDHNQGRGAACTISADFPEPGNIVHFTIKTTTTSGVYGVLQVLDENLNTIVSSPLR